MADKKITESTVNKIDETSKKALGNTHKALKSELAGFLDFMRMHGIVTLAIGFIIGGAVTTAVNSLVIDIINPIIGIFLGPLGDLSALKITIGSANIMIGNFISQLINLVIISFIIYYGVKYLKLDKIDKPKEKK